ncbi:MAG: hypothetical protein ACLQVM_09535 [Terriglobia bacterium]
MALVFSGTFLTNVKRTVPGNMADLIQAMIRYQLAAGPRIDELYIVYKEAQAWKQKHVSSFFATKQNLLEEAQVNILMGQVIDELNAATPGLGDALQGYGLRKAVGTTGKSFTALGKGYELERKTYLAGGKGQAPYSGSKIKDIADAKGIDFHSIKPKTWDQLSTASGADLAGAQPAVKMYFVNKIQRLKLRATCLDQGPAGHRWVDLQGNHMNTLFPNFRTMADPNACQLYALDRYGNLFVDYDNGAYGSLVLNAIQKPAKAAIDFRGYTNHSSLCAGREVICAGMIFFWKGQLIHVDNKSGHYAPKADALFKVVEVLRDGGTNIDYLRVGVATATDEKLYVARTFLAGGGGGQPDWPDQNPNNDHTQYFRNVHAFVY